jgi:uncharacterized protein (UPF0371 family)
VAKKEKAEDNLFLDTTVRLQDEADLRKLGVNLTSDPNFATKQLFLS